MTETSYDVAIAGGGMVGLEMAELLGARGRHGVLRREGYPELPAVRFFVAAERKEDKKEGVSHEPVFLLLWPPCGGIHLAPDKRSRRWIPPHDGHACSSVKEAPNSSAC